MTGHVTAALELAVNGWRVFPLPARSKVATLKGWQHIATTDPVTIRDWYTGFYRYANIAVVPTGRQVVLDVDSYKGAAEKLAELEAQHGEPIPSTRTALTPGGGRHLYLEAPEGVDVHRHDLANGLEVRCRGASSVVAPPSIHPTGGVYLWEDAEADVAEAPAWLFAPRTVVEAPPRPTRRPDNPRRGLDTLLHTRGRRDDLSAGDFAVACAALRDGLHGTDVIALIVEHRLRFGDPGNKGLRPDYLALTLQNAMAAIGGAR